MLLHLFCCLLPTPYHPSPLSVCIFLVPDACLPGVRILSKQFCWMCMLQSNTVKLGQSSSAMLHDMLLTVEEAGLRMISFASPTEVSADSAIKSAQEPGGAFNLLKAMSPGLLHLVFTRVTGNPPQPGQVLRDTVLGILRSWFQVHIAVKLQHCSCL